MQGEEGFEIISCQDCKERQGDASENKCYVIYEKGNIAYFDYEEIDIEKALACQEACGYVCDALELSEFAIESALVLWRLNNMPENPKNFLEEMLDEFLQYLTDECEPEEGWEEAWKQEKGGENYKTLQEFQEEKVRDYTYDTDVTLRALGLNADNLWDKVCANYIFTLRNEEDKGVYLTFSWEPYEFETFVVS